MKTTIHTIAKELGVAPSTVSKIINNTGNFSDELRIRVLEHIKKIGYAPEESARTLRSKKSWTIGVVLTEESNVGLEQPYFSSILQHFKTYVEEAGYDISFVVRTIGNVRMSYLKWCQNKKIDGVLIVVGGPNHPEIIELIESDIPCVSTDIVREGLCSVISDNEQGIKLSMDHLFSLGRKKIGIIPGPLTGNHFRQRFQTYKRIMQEKGITVPDSYMMSAKGFGFSSGYEAAKRFMETNKNNIPEAIIVGSDMLSYGVIRGIIDYGYKVPEDISVVGFDDILFSRMLIPSLTTIRQDVVTIGQTAGRILLDNIRHNKSKITDLIKIPVELVIRESTAAKAA